MKINCLKIFVTTFLFFTIYSGLSFADDPTPPTGGGGVIWGDITASVLYGQQGTNAGGATIEADEFSGAANYKVPISIPPARGGVSPQLILNYNSLRRNYNSWVGSGWELDLGAISRLPVTTGSDYFLGTSFEARFAGQTETLVLDESDAPAARYNLSVAPGQVVDLYRTKIEGSFNLFFHIRALDYSHDAGWVVVDRGGNRYYFGRTSASRESPGTSEGMGIDESRISRWLLERIEDSNGNFLTVNYNSQKQISSASYQDIQIIFETGQPTLPSGNIAFFPAFRESFIRPYQAFNVLNSIEIRQNGARLQKINFSYEASPIRHVRQLVRLDQYGRTDAEHLPPVSFRYFAEDQVSFSTESYTRQATRPNHPGWINNSATLADMNGDGLPDQVVADADGSFKVYFNTGNDFVERGSASRWADPFACGGGETDDPDCRGKLNADRDGHQWLFLMDINGDTLPDRIGRVIVANRGRANETAHFRIAFNNGHGWNSRTVEWLDPYQGGWAGTTDADKGFIDMNGDGLIDRVVGDASRGEFRIYFNTGAGFKQSPVIWRDSLVNYGTDAFGLGKIYAGEGTRTSVFIRDINGDGLPDRVTSVVITIDGREVGKGFGIDLNVGTGWAQPVPVSGVPHRVHTNGYDVISFLDPIADEGARGRLDKNYDLIDVNGDGFLDRVEGDTSRCVFHFYFYRGLIAGDALSQLSPGVEVRDPILNTPIPPPPLPPGTRPPVPAPRPQAPWPACGYVTNEDNKDYYVFFQDINGDGLPDRFALNRRIRRTTRDSDYNNTFVIYPLRLNNITFQDTPAWWNDRQVNQPMGALSEVIDEQGTHLALEYQPSAWPREEGVPNHQFLPFGMNLIHKIYSQDTSLPSGTAPTSPEMTRHPGMRWSTYLFSGGNYFVRLAVNPETIAVRGERTTRDHFARFNGFQKSVRVSEPLSGDSWPVVTTTSLFHQSLGDVRPLSEPESRIFDTRGYDHYALSGKLYRQITVEGSRQRADELHTWFVNRSAGNNFDCSADTLTSLRSCFPRETQRNKHVWENDGGERITRADTEYDRYGNIRSESFFDGVGNLLYKNETTYVPAEFFGTLLIRDRPDIKFIKGVGDTIYRKTQFAYDTHGNPNHEKKFYGSNPTNFLDFIKIFNSSGNAERLINPDGTQQTITYDSQGVFPIQSSKASASLGITLVEGNRYERSNGQLASESSPQGVEKGKTFDAFGRLETEFLRTTSGNTIQTRRYQYDYFTANLNGWNNSTIYRTQVWSFQPDYLSESRTLPSEISYADGSGQVLQKCLLSERGNYRQELFRIINGGREEIYTEPSFVASCPFVSQLPTDVRLFHKQKDLMGREISTVTPSGDSGSPLAGTNTNYRATAEGWLVKETQDPRGLHHIEILDHKDRVIEIRDPDGHVTRYTYNPADDLTQVESSGRILSTMIYDLMGRKTEMNDANMGHWIYRYNPQGHLESQTDNANQSIRYRYDGLGRKTRKESRRADESLEKVEIYTYDRGESGYSILPGELFEVDEQDGSGNRLRRTRFSYDSPLRVATKVSRLIPAVGEFHQTLSYDSIGRLASTTYPGLTRLVYEYLLSGQLGRVCAVSCTSFPEWIYYGLNPSASYNELGALLQENYGNGVVAQYDYYPLSHRLRSKTLRHGDQIYVQRNYTYDANSNILSITDPLHSQGASSYSNLIYDNLDRLTSVQKEGSSETSTLGYDDLGNITTNSASFNSDRYVYGTSRPNAVSQIGSRNYRYDDNGNLTSDPNRQMVYNAQNQLVQVTMNNGNIVRYDYDFNGDRASKQSIVRDAYHEGSRTQVTHYLGDGLEVQGDIVVLHVLANSKRVLTTSLGTVSSLAGIGGGSLIDTNFDPKTNPGHLIPILILFLTLLFLAAMRPFRQIPEWARSPEPILEKVFSKVYLAWRSYALTLQETFFQFPTHAFSKAFTIFLLILFVSQPMQFSYADEAIPRYPASDAHYAYYEHGDHLGSTNVITEGLTQTRHSGMVYRRGELLQRFEYSPFGQETFSLNPNLSIEPSYTGQKYDLETGLYFYKARYYDPVLGRFIQADTVVPNAYNSQDLNRYTYVRNNPIKYTDPSGHGFWSFFRNLLGFLLGILVIAAALVATILTAGIGGIAFAASLGGLIGAIGGGVIGAISAARNGGSISWGFGFGALVGGAGGAASGAIFSATAGALQPILNNIFSHGVAQMLTGMIAGIPSGIVSGTTQAIAQAFAGGQGSLADIGRAALRGGILGATAGAGMGGVLYGLTVPVTLSSVSSSGNQLAMSASHGIRETIMNFAVHNAPYLAVAAIGGANAALNSGFLERFNIFGFSSSGSQVHLPGAPNPYRGDANEPAGPSLQRGLGGGSRNMEEVSQQLQVSPATR